MEDEIEDVELLDIEEQEEVEHEEELGFSLDDEEAQDDITDLPKHLRNQIKERDRRLAVLERQNQELQAKTAPDLIEAGPRPKAEDYDYDDDKFEAALDEWASNVKAAASQPRPDPDADLQQEFQQDQASFQSGVNALKFEDREEVISDVMSALTPAQYAGFVTSGLKDPATLMYALGKQSPEKLRQILNIRNHAKFLVELARMEARMTVGSKRTPPPAENVRKGTAATVSSDKKLDALEKKASITGDRSELIRYRKSLKAA